MESQKSIGLTSIKEFLCKKNWIKGIGIQDYHAYQQRISLAGNAEPKLLVV